MLVVIWLVGILEMLKEKEQTQKEGWDGLQGRTEIPFWCRKWGVKLRRDCMCVHVCLYASSQLLYDLCVCLRLCHPEKQLSWEHGCQRNRHISTLSLFSVLLLNIQYHSPPHTQVYFCFYFDVVLCFFLSSLFPSPLFFYHVVYQARSIPTRH